MGEEKGRAHFSIPISVNTQRWNAALPSLFANQYYTYTWGKKKDWVKEHYIFNLDTISKIFMEVLQRTFRLCLHSNKNFFESLKFQQKYLNIR